MNATKETKEFVPKERSGNRSWNAEQMPEPSGISHGGTGETKPRRTSEETHTRESGRKGEKGQGTDE